MTQNSINTTTSILQKLTTKTSSVVTCTTAILADDSIPQNTEGDEVLTLAITPVYSTSKLLIEFTTIITNDANANSITTALFQDSTADALAACCAPSIPASRSTIGSLRHIMTSGTTSSTTLKIRVGPSANTCYVNGDPSGNALMGGTQETRLTITELL